MRSPCLSAQSLIILAVFPCLATGGRRRHRQREPGRRRTQRPPFNTARRSPMESAVGSPAEHGQVSRRGRGREWGKPERRQQWGARQLGRRVRVGQPSLGRIQQTAGRGVVRHGLKVSPQPICRDLGEPVGQHRSANQQVEGREVTQFGVQRFRQFACQAVCPGAKGEQGAVIDPGRIGRSRGAASVPPPRL